MVNALGPKRTRSETASHVGGAALTAKSSKLRGRIAWRKAANATRHRTKQTRTRKSARQKLVLPQWRDLSEHPGRMSEEGRPAVFYATLTRSSWRTSESASSVGAVSKDEKGRQLVQKRPRPIAKAKGGQCFSSPDEARRVIIAYLKGWCCLNGNVFPSTPEDCLSKRGGQRDLSLTGSHPRIRKIASRAGSASTTSQRRSVRQTPKQKIFNAIVRSRKRPRIARCVGAASKDLSLDRRSTRARRIARRRVANVTTHRTRRLKLVAAAELRHRFAGCASTETFSR